MAAENPAVTFLQIARGTSPETLVRDYARFLLVTAHAYRLPVPLDRIRARFSLPVRRQSLAASGGQRGWTTPDLEIYLNADDLPTVQNFTFGHELMELLFYALDDCAADDSMDEHVLTGLLDAKERLCEMGAADVILPMDLFEPLAVAQPLSLNHARSLARECGVSLTATIRRIFQIGRDRGLVCGLGAAPW